MNRSALPTPRTDLPARRETGGPTGRAGVAPQTALEQLSHVCSAGLAKLADVRRTVARKTSPCLASNRMRRLTPCRWIPWWARGGHGRAAH